MTDLTRRAVTATLSTLSLVPTLAAGATPPLPAVDTGRIERLAIASAHVDARPVDVWLPASYQPTVPHAVLYVHDGQMLFDARITWNRQAWQLHRAVERLMREGRIPPTLVVGVWNVPGQRYAEYFPQKMLARLPDALRQEYLQRDMGGRARADAYLRFLVDELKPAIDRRYATRAGPQTTAVMGSSMGGLASLYALCEHPQVFGAAAALSTHWVGLPTAWGPERLRNAAVPLAAFGYLQQTLPAPGQHRLYLDRGTADLEAFYAPHQAFVDELLHDRGYRAGDWMSRVVDGAGHNEQAWAARADVAVGFVLGGR